MKKHILLVLLSCSIAFSAGCGSGDTSEETSSNTSAETSTNQETESTAAAEQAEEETKEPLDLSGNWESESTDEDTFQAGYIKDDVIEIYWVIGGEKMLYWSGSYDAPTESTDSYTWDSKNDTSKTESALMASSDETKTFTYENDAISYEVTVQGETGTIVLKRTDTDYSSGEESSSSGSTFKDNVLVMDDYTIKITDYKVIQKGETGNEYGEKPVIAFWYDTTNTSDSDDIDPSTAWIMVFTAIQDNDPNKVNELEIGSLPDEQFLDSQMENIKSGGTVSNAVAYELDDLETPVTLRAEDILSGSYGEQTFEIKGK